MPLHDGGSQTKLLIPRDTTTSRQHTHERNFEFFVRVVDFFARQPWRNLSTTAQRGQSTLSCGELQGVMAEGLAASHGSHHVSVNASLEVEGMPSPSCSRLQQSPCVLPSYSYHRVIADSRVLLIIGPWTSKQVQCCFTSTETVRTIRDGEPSTATSTFTQLLSSESSSVAAF